MPRSRSMDEDTHYTSAQVHRTLRQSAVSPKNYHTAKQYLKVHNDYGPYSAHHIAFRLGRSDFQQHLPDEETARPSPKEAIQ